MDQTVYVLSFANPDGMGTEVFAHKARCRDEFRKMINTIQDQMDEPSIDMILDDGADEGNFYDGYVITIQWAQADVIQ